LVLCLAAPGAAAHQAAEADGVPTLATAWTLDPWLIAPLAIMLLLYAVGACRLWRAVGVARVTAFALGAACLFAALVWPLDAYGEWSFAAHMAQHMILLAAAPPLLLLGRPGPAMVAALPPQAGRMLAVNTARYDLAVDPTIPGYGEAENAFFDRLSTLIWRPIHASARPCCSTGWLGGPMDAAAWQAPLPSPSRAGRAASPSRARGHN
jgi:hypothetical protein